MVEQGNRGKEGRNIALSREICFVCYLCGMQEDTSSWYLRIPSPGISPSYMTSAVSAVTSAVRAVVKPHLTAVLCGQDPTDDAIGLS